MPQLTQGLIIAGLIGLLLAVIVGYYLRQGRVNELTETLQQSQKRQEDLEKEHERRLRDATQQLQRDYEAQLGEKMEQYQARLEQQRSQLESEYRARQSVMGGAPVDADSTTEQRIRKQYETRLKEAATKIQQAYEQHLQEKLVEARSQAQQDYDQRLAAAIAHYQDQSEVGQGQTPGEISLGALVPEATAAAGSGVPALAELEARLQAEYDQRLAQMAQDYEARLQTSQASAPASGAEPSAAELELNLRRELEARLEAEYEQKLAEKIEHYQDELTKRTQELEQAYEARLQLLQTTAPGEGWSPAGESTAGEGGFDLEGAIAAANEVTWAADQETRLDMDEFSRTAAPSAVENDNPDGAVPASETGSVVGDDLTWNADLTSDPLDLETSATAPAFDLTADELALEVISPPLEGDSSDWSAILEDGTVSDQASDFNSNTDFPADPLDLDTPWPEPAPDAATDGVALEAASPEVEAGDSGLADLLESEVDRSQPVNFGDFSPETDFAADPLDLDAPGPEPASDSAVDEFSLEATSPELNEGDDFGFPSLLEGEADRVQTGDFGDFNLETDFTAEPLDLGTPGPEPTSEFAEDEGDLSLAALLDNSADSALENDFNQADDFNLDADFNTDSLDLDALLNAPGPEPAEEDLLDDLDDLSNLS